MNTTKPNLVDANCGPVVAVLLIEYERQIKRTEAGKAWAETEAAMMWQALIIHANPYKCGMGHLLMGRWSDPKFKAACD